MFAIPYRYLSSLPGTDASSDQQAFLSDRYSLLLLYFHNQQKTPAKGIQNKNQVAR